MTQAIHIHQRHAQEQCVGTKTMLCAVTQWGDHETIRHLYGRKDEREAGEMICNISDLPVMVQFTMDLKINIYLEILLERQSQKH